MLYTGYRFPFEKLHDKIYKMNEVQRRDYFQKARELKENQVHIDVMQEAIRKLYQTLSVRSNGKYEQNAYRATLSWVQSDIFKVIDDLAISFHENKLPKERRN